MSRMLHTLQKCGTNRAKMYTCPHAFWKVVGGHSALGKLAALDISPNYIGIAFSDAQRTVARAAGVLRMTKNCPLSKRRIEIGTPSLMSELRSSVAGWIIGLPLELCGNQGAAAENVMQMAETLEKNLRVLLQPALFFDERYSTVAARSQLDDTRLRHFDDCVAADILQQFLDLVQRPDR